VFHEFHPIGGVAAIVAAADASGPLDVAPESASEVEPASAREPELDVEPELEPDDDPDPELDDDPELAPASDEDDPDPELDEPRAPPPASTLASEESGAPPELDDPSAVGGEPEELPGAPPSCNSAAGAEQAATTIAAHAPTIPYRSARMSR
jgi:hypothetical protein